MKLSPSLELTEIKSQKKRRRTLKGGLQADIRRKVIQDCRRIGGQREEQAGDHCYKLLPVPGSAGVSLVMVNGLSTWLGKQLHNDKC